MGIVHTTKNVSKLEMLLASQLVAPHARLSLINVDLTALVMPGEIVIILLSMIGRWIATVKGLLNVIIHLSIIN